MADILDSTVWTETDSGNVTGTRPTWPEGMPAKDVNDSARALQGALKRWADQICATVTTAGTGSAYTVSYSVAPQSIFNGQRFCVLAHVVNAATPTLNINSLGAKTIKKMTSTGVIDLVANDILVNMVLDLVYVSSINQFVWLNPPPTAASSGGGGGGGTVTAHTHPISDITGLQATLDAKAALAGATFTGAVNGPTAAVGTNTTQLATTAHVYENMTKEVSSTSTVLVASDAGKLVTLTGATCTVNSGVFTANNRVDILQLGATQVTVSGSATGHSRSGFKLAGQYAGATIWFMSASEYVLMGDTTV